MPPIVPVGLEEEPPTDSDNEFYSEDELPNFAFQEDLADSDSSQSPTPDDESVDPERQSISPTLQNNANYAYELLPQEPEVSHQNSALDIVISNTQIPVLDREHHPVEEEESNTEIAEPIAPPTLELDKDQIEKIKAVMTKVTLPSSAIPNWASDIPEDSWKEHLISKIQAKSNT